MSKGFISTGVNVKHFLRVAALFILRVRVRYSAGSLNQLGRGKTITVANHVSLLDGPILALLSPVPMTFAVHTDYSRRSRLAVAGMNMMARMGFGSVVPLDSQSPYGMRKLLRVLDEGGNVMIFPEGGINGGTVQPGLSWLMDKSGAGLVEVKITGAEKSRLFAKNGVEWMPRIGVEF